MDYLFSHILDKSKHLVRNSVYYLVVKADRGLWLNLLRHKRFTDLASKLKDDPYILNAFTHHKNSVRPRVYSQHSIKGETPFTQMFF